jgi:hypothetical protein
MLALALQLGVGCSKGGYSGGHGDGSVHDAHGMPEDASMPMADLVGPIVDGAADLRGAADLAPAPDLAGSPDLAVPSDLAVPPDLAVRPDLASPPDLTPSGPITGGPCISGSRGATALRVRWSDSGGRATVNYEVQGLPDRSRFKVSVYGRSIGFTPTFADPFLGAGGVQLDGSDFIDVEMSTVGVSRISSFTISILGRSYSTGSSGSFNWMSFTGAGSTATDFVSNVAPYRWYAADATGDIATSDGGILLRIQAGPSSGSLVVNRLELCIDVS